MQIDYIHAYARLQSNTGDDVLRGGAGADTLLGGTGNDFLIGGPGDDFLDGGGGFDISSYEDASSGVTVDLTTPSNSRGAAAGDVLISIEGVVGSRYGDILRGDANANYLRGGDGNDSLQGGAGDDTLQGGRGFDKMIGGTGADRFLFAAGDGDDTISDFRHGEDMISLARSAFGFNAIQGEERALTSADADFITKGSAATSGKATFFWNAATGVLSFDADGNGSDQAFVLATLGTGAKLTLSDIWTIDDAAMTGAYLLAATRDVPSVSPLSLTAGPTQGQDHGAVDEATSAPDILQTAASYEWFVDPFIALDPRPGTGAEPPARPLYPHGEIGTPMMIVHDDGMNETPEARFGDGVGAASQANGWSLGADHSLSVLPWMPDSAHSCLSSLPAFHPEWAFI